MIIARREAFKKEGSIIGIAIILGIVIGAGTGNIGLWVGLGMCFGATIESVRKTTKK